MVEYRESRGNRAGDGIRAGGAGSGRDRAGTLPAEDYFIASLTFALLYLERESQNVCPWQRRLATKSNVCKCSSYIT